MSHLSEENAPQRNPLEQLLCKKDFFVKVFLSSTNLDPHFKLATENHCQEELEAAIENLLLEERVNEQNVERCLSRAKQLIDNHLGSKTLSSHLSIVVAFSDRYFDSKQEGSLSGAYLGNLLIFGYNQAQNSWQTLGSSALNRVQFFEWEGAEDNLLLCPINSSTEESLESLISQARLPSQSCLVRLPSRSLRSFARLKRKSSKLASLAISSFNDLFNPEKKATMALCSLLCSSLLALSFYNMMESSGPQTHMLASKTSTENWSSGSLPENEELKTLAAAQTVVSKNKKQGFLSSDEEDLLLRNCKKAIDEKGEPLQLAFYELLYRYSHIHDAYHGSTQKTTEVAKASLPNLALQFNPFDSDSGSLAQHKKLQLALGGQSLLSPNQNYTEFLESLKKPGFIAIALLIQKNKTVKNESETTLTQ